MESAWCARLRQHPHAKTIPSSRRLAVDRSLWTMPVSSHIACPKKFHQILIYRFPSPPYHLW